MELDCHRMLTHGTKYPRTPVFIRGIWFNFLDQRMVLDYAWFVLAEDEDIKYIIVIRRNHLSLHRNSLRITNLLNKNEFEKSEKWRGGEVVTSLPINWKIRSSKPTLIRARCLRVRQRYPAQKKKVAFNSQAGTQQWFAYWCFL